jgi:hypothetical protein
MKTRKLPKLTTFIIRINIVKMNCYCSHRCVRSNILEKECLCCKIKKIMYVIVDLKINKNIVEQFFFTSRMIYFEIILIKIKLYAIVICLNTMRLPCKNQSRVFKYSEQDFLRI